jgi:hypothetical protein
LLLAGGGGWFFIISLLRFSTAGPGLITFAGPQLLTLGGRVAHKSVVLDAGSSPAAVGGQWAAGTGRQRDCGPGDDNGGLLLLLLDAWWWPNGQLVIWQMMASKIKFPFARCPKEPAESSAVLAVAVENALLFWCWPCLVLSRGCLLVLMEFSEKMPWHIKWWRLLSSLFWPTALLKVDSTGRRVASICGGAGLPGGRGLRLLGNVESAVPIARGEWVSGLNIVQKSHQQSNIV